MNTEATAKALLPCEHLEDLPGYYNDPAECYACEHRPAVAAALAERDAEREELENKWRGQLENIKGFYESTIAQLRAKLAEANSLHDLIASGGLPEASLAERDAASGKKGG
jgi:hypothetical protein